MIIDSQKSDSRMSLMEVCTENPDTIAKTQSSFLYFDKLLPIIGFEFVFRFDCLFIIENYLNYQIMSVHILL